MRGVNSKYYIIKRFCSRRYSLGNQVDGLSSVVHTGAVVITRIDEDFFSRRAITRIGEDSSSLEE